MPGRRGSWPALLALAVAFVVLFYWQRSRSTFLRIERERPAARVLAERAMIPVADILALRDMVGLHAPMEQWERLVGDYGTYLRQLDWADAPPGYPPVGAAAQDVAAWSIVPVTSAARRVASNELAQRRFLLLRERFAARR